MDSTNTPWVIKYLPQDPSTIIGRDEEIKQLNDFLDNFPQKKRAVLLYGPCGSGKTSIVHALANQRNFELLEINASDSRNKDQILEKIKPAIEQRSFFHDGKIVLVDEIDGLSGQKDRGGAITLAKLIEKSAVPIILTANDGASDKLKPILKQAIAMSFDRLDATSILIILKKIAAKESIIAEESILQTIANHSDGDVRAAINDLELVSKNKTISKEDLDIISHRKRTSSITQALTTMYKSTTAMDGIEGFNDVDEDINTRLLWIDYNTPTEYTNPADLARAYGALSRADVFLGRIRRNQEWRFWVYANQLMTGGVTIAKDAPYKKFVEYKRSSRLLKIWQINMSMAKRKAIAQKIADKTHLSKRQAYAQVEFFKIMCHNKDVRQKLVAELDLDADEVKWLQK